MSRRGETHCEVVVIWIDWYPYHVARFRGMQSGLAGRCVGLELVGGIGVHAGLKFREVLPQDLPIQTLLPNTAWAEANHLSLAWMLWRRLSQLDPRIVLVPGYYTLPAVAAALWARLHGSVSVLMTESTAFDHDRLPWKEHLKAIGIKVLFDRAITGGKAHVSYLKALRFPKDRISGHYDVVDNSFYRKGTAALKRMSPGGRKKSQPYFLFVGRLAQEKNIRMLIEAWTDYRKAGGSWHLVLAGDGAERSSLQEVAQASGHVDDVEFTGLKSSRELLEFYSFAKCFVLPSRREPWGLVVNEAMASGLPVLVSNRCGCVSDLVAEGQNGFSFDPSKPGELTALMLLVGNMTAEERRKMSQRSTEIITEFSPEHFGASVCSIVGSQCEPRGLQAISGENL